MIVFVFTTEIAEVAEAKESLHQKISAACPSRRRNPKLELLPQRRKAGPERSRRGRAGKNECELGVLGVLARG
jgi:hypothetical protein